MGTIDRFAKAALINRVEQGIECRDKGHQRNSPMTKGPYDGQPIQFRHLQIEEGRIGLYLLNQSNRFFTALGRQSRHLQMSAAWSQETVFVFRYALGSFTSMG